MALSVGAVEWGTTATDPQVEPPAEILAALPTLSISDPTVLEGDAGTLDAVFTVTISGSFSEPVSVDYATADNSAAALHVTRVAAGLTNPLFATAPPGDNGRLFIVEQGAGGVADIEVLHRGTGEVNPLPLLRLSGLTTGGEQGLLGLAFDPDFASNQFFYVNFTDAAGDTHVVRYRVSDGDPDRADPASGLAILTIDQPQSNHNGGWMAFGPDGMLYIATGDGGGSDDNDAGHTAGTGNAQDITDNLLGKILRIDVSSDGFPADPNRNYAIPASNPFVGETGDDEIWAYGLRNPWRNSFDRLTGDLYLADVGQGNREEINVQPGSSAGGENYGWRLREGTIATPTGGVGGARPPGAVDPIYDYAHAAQPIGAASVTGGYVYRGPIQELQGQYFFADFINSTISSLRFDGSDPSSFDGTNYTDLTHWTDFLVPDAGNLGPTASFGETPDGALFIVDRDGEVFQLGGGGDYLPASGTLAFSPGGPTSATIRVSVLGDRVDEIDETFRVNLSNAANATIADGSGLGTILDDDDAVEPAIRTDLAGRVAQSGQWWLARSTGSQFTTSAWGSWQSGGGTWLDVQQADVDGDGLPDLVGRWSTDGSWWVARNQAAGEPVNERWGVWSTAVAWRDVRVGDFDGDGDDDLAGRAANTGQWWVAVSDGTGGFENSPWGDWNAAVSWVDVQVGDFDSDGDDDLVGRAANTGQWWSARSDGVNGFDNQLWGRWSPSVAWVDVRAGDFNADGYRDLVGRASHSGQWWVARNNAASGFENGLWGGWNAAVDWLDVAVGDFNGDGWDDIVGRAGNLGTWWVARSDGNGVLHNELWGRWSAIPWHDVRVADFTGDGRDDLAGRTAAGQWWVARSNGATAFAEDELWGAWAADLTWLDVLADDFVA